MGGWVVGFGRYRKKEGVRRLGGCRWVREVKAEEGREGAGGYRWTWEVKKEEGRRVTKVRWVRGLWRWRKQGDECGRVLRL